MTDDPDAERAESRPPTVLAVDDDEKLLETYRLWFDDEYDLRTARDGEAAIDRLDETVEVVLLDRLMPGGSGEETLDRIRETGVDCRVAMITAVEPGVDIATMPFDAYLTKPLDRETVRETIERLRERASYDDLLREHYALAEKLATLEETTAGDDLADSEEYRRLVERFERVDDRLDERASSLDPTDLVGAIDDPD